MLQLLLKSLGVMAGLMLSSSQVTANAPAQTKAVTPAKTGVSLPPLLLEVEKIYAAAKSVKADFEQTTFSTLGSKKVTQGTIYSVRPGKIRWETKSPDASLLISDGKTYWYYTPPFDSGEPGQVVIKKSTEVQSQLAHALLAGSFSLAKKMDVRKVSENRFFIYPRKGTAGTVRKIELEIDSKEKWIQKISLEHEDGNRADIVLSKIELGIELPETHFQFKAPPNTDVVNP